MPASSTVPRTPHVPFTERIVDRIAEHEDGIDARALASHFKKPIGTVRDELLELEKLGIVIRSGVTRGTRWHLG